MLVPQLIPLTHQRLPADLRRPDISATHVRDTSDLFGGALVGRRQLNQNNPAERLREGMRLFLKLKIDA